MIYDDTDLAGAVFIFSEDKDLIREMNYSEFEALLDGYVPAMDLANRVLNGVYVEINSQYHIVNAVFYLVRFCSSGFVDQDTSVPLIQLAQHSRKGVNLGHGPIGLVCAAQCPIKHMSAYMWDPDLRTKHEFKVLNEAVVRNRMAIHFNEPDPEIKIQQSQRIQQQKDDRQSRAAIELAVTDRLRKEFDKELRDRMAHTIREQRLKANALLLQRERSVAELKQQYNARIEEYRLILDQNKSLIDEFRDRNSALKETIDGQAEKIKGLREYFEVKVEQAETFDHDQLQELITRHELEMEAQLESETKELKEMLQMREVEILYRNEQEAKVHEELDRVHKENEELIANSGDHLLGRMLETGISFVTYQPGAGHITLPVSEIPLFMDNPTTYVANKCGVSENHYDEWLEHFHMPVCQAVENDGNLCGGNIIRVESPADYIVGESDCCHQHKAIKAPKLKIAGNQ